MKFLCVPFGIMLSLCYAYAPATVGSQGTCPSVTFGQMPEVSSGTEKHFPRAYVEVPNQCI